MAKQINFNGYLIRRYGAYIRTDISNLVDINGIASGIIGLVGLSETGKVGEPIIINGYKELLSVFGDGPIVRHGLAMYVGGAQTLVVVRIGNPNAASLSATVVGAVNGKTYDYVARERGTIGNAVAVSVSAIDTLSNTPSTGAATASSALINDDYTELNVRHISRLGEEDRERFLFPKYIPDTVDSNGRSRFYSHNGFAADGTTVDKTKAFYFILRNRDTGYVREVPKIWSYGLVTEDDFLKKVDTNKDGIEDLISFPVYTGTSRNLYPIAIVQHVLNHGSFGYAPSNYITLNNVEPALQDILSPADGSSLWTQAVAETLMEHPFTSLSGGTNGDDGSGYYSATGDTTYGADATTLNTWNDGLAALEEEGVNFVQPAILYSPLANGKTGTTWSQRYGLFANVSTKIVAHVRNMSNTLNRNYRMSFLGLPYYKSIENANKTADDFLSDIENVSGLINEPRIQLWAGGFKSRSFSNAVENYGADMLASFVAGLNAARNPEQSITFLQIAGIFTDGLEFYYNSNQKNELYGRSINFVERVRSFTGAIEFRAAHNLTSWTGASNRGLQLVITQRIVDYMNSFVYKNLEENFIGQKSLGSATAGILRDYTEVLLRRLVSEGKLVAYADVVARPFEGDPTVYEIFYRFQPVSEIDFITVTNTLTYSLA